MSRIKDLTGQTFGQWTVLRKSDKKTKNRQIYWYCRCSCGNEKDVAGGNLRNGSSTNCGCKRKQTLQAKAKNITNQRFGKLIAIKPTNQRKNNNVIWECKCDCGNVAYIPLASLTSGNTQSCGCLHKNIMHEIQVPKLIGKKFHHLVVLKEAGIDKHGKQLWECECDCINHNHIIVPTSSLTTGNTQSCGCQKSKGEAKIISILTQNNIIFQRQKCFNSCRFSDTNAMARFDFYINNQYLIEYDGIQHFQKTKNDKFNFNKIKKHDNYKNQWCKENNIPLIRIPYTHLKDLCIEDLKLETSKFII